VAAVDRSVVGASHAVYLVTLADGRACVARFATHPEHELRREVWVTERCRRAGVPAPRLLAADLAPSDGTAPVAVYERLPGEPGHAVVLSPRERVAVLEEMSRHAARIHAIKIPGVGTLAPCGNGYAGASGSWADHTQTALARRLAELPAGTLPAKLAATIRQRFAAARPAFAAAVPADGATSALVHGDFRLENALVARTPGGAPYVSAILDFEMGLAGDGAVDLAWLSYQDARNEGERAAVLSGYGASAADRQLRQRLLLYQVHYALGHLWWEVGFQDAAGATRVVQRISALLAAHGAVG
jgi:aminoglycoside phosphotransferase (APT) family kinase protein